MGERAVLVKPALVLAVTAALTLLAWRTALAQPDGRLHIYLFNLEGQNSWLVRTPGGESLLIDGSASTKAISDILARRLPPSQRSLSAWLYTGAESSLKGLPGLFERYPPRSVYRCADIPNRGWGKDLRARFGELPDPILTSGQILEMGAAVGEVTSPAEGCGLIVRYERFEAALEDGTLRLWDGQILSASPGGWLHLTTDGMQVWLEKGDE